jgi:hypothetical protein
MNQNYFGYVEGRVYKGVEDPNYNGTLLTKDELNNLKDDQIIGLPVYYDHDYKKDTVGIISKYFIDNEGWLNIGAYIYNDNEFREEVYNRLKSGDLSSFSIGYSVGLSDEDLSVTGKKIIETSVTNDPVIIGTDILICNSKNKKKKENKYLEIPFNNKKEFSLNFEKMSEKNQDLLSKRKEALANGKDPREIDELTEEEIFLKDLENKPQEEVAKSWIRMFRTVKQKDQEVETLKKEREEAVGRLTKYDEMRERSIQEYVERQKPEFENVKNYLSSIGALDLKNEEDTNSIYEIMTTEPGINLAKKLSLASRSYNEHQQKLESLQTRNSKLEGIINELKQGTPMSNEEFSDSDMMVQNSRRNKRLFDSLFNDDDNNSNNNNNNNNNISKFSRSSNSTQNSLNDEPPDKKQKLNIGCDRDRLYNDFGIFGIEQSLISSNPSLWNQLKSTKDSPGIGVGVGLKMN